MQEMSHKKITFNQSHIAMEKKQMDGFCVVYRKGTVDEGILKQQSFKNDIYLSPINYFRSILLLLLNYHIKKNDVIIDIGAHIGTFSLLSASKATNGIVYAVEPCRENFYLLEKNVELNQLKNVKCINAALGGNEGDTKLYHGDFNVGYTTTKQLSDQYEWVKEITLDKFFVENKVNICNFMKMNCEGSEYPILLNASPYCLSKIIRIIILYHKVNIVGYETSDLIHYLEKNNFKIIQMKTSSTQGWLFAYRKPLPLDEKIKFHLYKLGWMFRNILRMVFIPIRKFIINLRK